MSIQLHSHGGVTESLTSVPKKGELKGIFRRGELEDPLEPVGSVVGLSAEKVFQCLPDGRLDDVDVGENGESGANAAGSGGIKRGGDLDMRWVSL